MPSGLVESFGGQIFAFPKFRTTTMECEINSGVILMRLFINVYLGDVEKIKVDLSRAILSAKFLLRVMFAK